MQWPGSEYCPECSFSFFLATKSFHRDQNMEIDEINLQDELTSGCLVKYLNGEISFHEWLQLQSSDNGDNTEENVLGDEIVPNELNDVNMLVGADEIVAQDHNGVLLNHNILIGFYISRCTRLDSEEISVAQFHN